MAYKFIPQSWKDSEAYNIDHKYNFYINPRGRVFPALTATGITFAKNTIHQNMRGTYYMQTGASTDLSYLYQLPQRFIIEGWVKPKFLYTIASDQILFADTGNKALIYYYATEDKIVFQTVSGGTNDFLTTSAFASTNELNRWIYFRCFFDNTAKRKGFYLTSNGSTKADTSSTPPAGSFIPSNKISYYPTVSTDSSYIIIHELDKELSIVEYKTYQADRQIIFDFDGTTLGRERIRIAREYIPGTDVRGTLDFSCRKELNKSSQASIRVLNTNGAFSDDQYDIFDPYNGYYNGTQKYLQNKISIEIESKYSRTGSILDIPNGEATYIQNDWLTLDNWQEFDSATLTAEHKKLIISGAGYARNLTNRIIASAPQQYMRIRARQISGTLKNIYIDSEYSGGYVTSNLGIASRNFLVHTVTLSIPTYGNILSQNLYLSGYSSDDILEIDWIYIGDKSELIDPIIEPIFIGTSVDGAFKRGSTNRYNGIVNIEAEDVLSEIANMKVNRSYGYDTFDLSKNSDETTSLTHSIARLATKKEIRNYVFNSSGENATPSNSFTNSGGTLTRDNTSVLFGSYALKYVATGAGQYYRQVIKFESNDKIDVGDKFNFSVFINQGTASMVRIKMEELTSAGALVGTESYSDSGTDTGVFTRINVSREIAASTATQLRITIYALGASTFYADGFMLTRGIDPIDYFLLNATDGSSGSGSADSAATYLYDTVAFDFDTVAVTHPYYLVEKGDSPLDHLQDIADASIARGLFVTEDGVLKMPVAYNETNAANLGDIEDAGEISTQLDNTAENSVEVHGVVIVKETQERILFDGSGVGLVTDSGGKILHPIANGAEMAIAGVTSFELIYKEDE